MLIIRRQPKIRRRQRRRGFGGDGLHNIIGNTIKSIANKITAQKVADAVVNGGIKSATELAVKRAFEKKPEKKKQSPRIDTLNALVNGSGIIYE